MPGDSNNWTLIIKPKSSWFDLKLKDIWQYRDLVMLFVKRDFVAVYKQTILGPFWHVIQPLLTTLTYTFIFGRIARISTDGLPQFLFYLSGIVMWTYFSRCLVSASGTFIYNANIFGKVYFPRFVIPLSVVISNLVAFGIQFVFFLIFLCLYYFKGTTVHPNPYILLLPVLISLMALLGLGLGIIVSAMTIRYRDLRFLVQFGVQLFMYATPVIYPLSTIPEKYRHIISLNPMSPIIETFRYAFLGSGTTSASALIQSTFIIVAIFIVGLLLFNRVEKNFIDTV